MKSIRKQKTRLNLQQHLSQVNPSLNEASLPAAGQLPLVVADITHFQLIYVLLKLHICLLLDWNKNVFSSGLYLEVF